MESRKEICLPTRNNKDTIDLDRLGNLPESLLHHILSFLHTIDVIQTSLLSKKWRCLWTSVPVLRLNETHFRNTPKPQHRDFSEFVTTLLSLRQTSTILTFRLSQSGTFCNPIDDIIPWTRVAVEGNVRVLDLDILPHYWIKTVQFPNSLFTCKSLTHFMLNLGDYENERCFEVPVPDFIHLPALKYIFLGSIRKVGTAFLDKFFTGCPVLEVLEINCCEFDEFNCVTISAAQLKHLAIEFFEKARDENVPPGYPSRYEPGCTDRCKIVVATPNLVTFTSADYALHDYSFENLLCLEEADIGKEISKEWIFDTKLKGYNPVVTTNFTYDDSNTMVKCLRELSTVRSLALNFVFLEAVSRVSAEVLKRLFTPFTNLRHLQLSTLMTEAHVRGIMFLLQNCSNINTLAIKMISAEETSVDIAKCWGKEFLLKSLEHIEVQYIEGSSDEVEFLNVLLKIAVTLRKMTIFVSERLSADNDSRLDAFRDEISACEWRSSNVEIAIRKS